MADEQKKKGGRMGYDWQKIMNDYISMPNGSLKKISEKYGIRLATVTDHSRAEGWVAARKEYQEKLRRKASEKLLTKQAGKLVRELGSVDNVSKRIQKLLQDEKQFNRHIIPIEYPVEMENGKISIKKTSAEVEFEKVDTRALRDILMSLKMIEDMKRSMLNIQKGEQLERAQIERERLQLEREKFEFEKEKAKWMRGIQDTDENVYGVVILPEVNG